jgi:hypothetical protein
LFISPPPPDVGCWMPAIRKLKSMETFRQQLCKNSATMSHPQSSRWRGSRCDPPRLAARGALPPARTERRALDCLSPLGSCRRSTPPPKPAQDPFATLRDLLVTPAMAEGSDRLKSIDDENCPFNI